MARRRFKIRPSRLILQLLAWQGGICSICGEPALPQHCNKDHVHPRRPPARWVPGPDTLANIMAAHQHCNSAKGNSIPDKAYVARLNERNRRIGQPVLDLPRFRPAASRHYCP